MQKYLKLNTLNLNFLHAGQFHNKVLDYVEFTQKLQAIELLINYRLLALIMHEKISKPDKNRAPMIRYPNPRQIPLCEFETPFLTQLDEHNRWIKLSQCIPCNRLADAYH